ncbi:unnamed protein product [Blepharisma stoltei]|uniref:Nudix hydrolase domain-containing protein n=1 Tax=Blepharisma stoltei TaxID=1481888 RepID=A0AAU9IG77_9CILI|nr:unnamed protein product [Blepharisma stoltei]
MPLHRFLKLAEKLAADSIKENDYIGRRASIAAIFKIVPKIPSSFIPSNTQNFQITNQDQLKQYFENQPWVNDGDLQLLFIKRTQHPKDKHSGQVAFPGGKVEKGETPYQAAVRETYEEIGLDLSDQNKFAYVGAMKEIFPYYHRNMLLGLYVFIQLTPENHLINLSPNEVHSYRWVSFDNFTHKFKEIYKPIEFSKNITLIKSIGLQINVNGHTAGVVLPKTPSIDSYTYNEKNPPDRTTEYHLWGITFRRVKSLVFLLPEEERNTTIRDWSYFSIRGPYKIMNRLLLYDELNFRDTASKMIYLKPILSACGLSIPLFFFVRSKL